MHPELFEIPFLHISVKTYGTLMVVGFLVALWLMRRMMRRMGQNPDNISNVAMYSLICGVAGARVFYIVHHHVRPAEWLAIWQGGLELLGGVIAAIAFLLIYLYRQKLPKLAYLDVLAVGLLVGLGFGRIGCLMYGCCYGKCSDVPWAIRFPYRSPAFESQVYPDPARGRDKPLLELPESYFTNGYLKDFDELTIDQQDAVKKGPYRTLAVHPTQIYSSIDAFVLAGILYALWRWIGQRKPGIVMSVMLILYGIMRFYIETLRGDNPFEHAWWTLYQGGTVSQNICIYMIIAGTILLTIIATRKPVQVKK